MPYKNQHTPTSLSPTTNKINTDPHLPDGRGSAPLDEMSQHNQEQRDEFDALQSIYQDAFQKLEGKPAAWQKHNNLAYSIHLTALNDLEIFVDLEVELPKDYPKAEPNINVTRLQLANASVSSRVRQIVKQYPKSNRGRVIIYDLCDTVSQILENDASIKAGKPPVLTLEEERMAQQFADLKEEDAKMQQLQGHDGDDNVQANGLPEQKTKVNKPSKVMVRKHHRAASSDVGPVTDLSPGLVSFAQPMTARDTLTKNDFSFNTVAGRVILLRRKDKTVTLVNPVAQQGVYVPQLMLKDIRLPENVTESTQMRDTMREVEDLLEETKEYRHVNIVDVIGYSVRRVPVSEAENPSLRAFWELAILTEYTKKGSLQEHLEITGSLRADIVRSWTHQLLEALEFFDKHGYVHPAVHEGNILIFLAPRGDVTIKLSDGYGTVLRTLVNKAKPASPFSTAETPFWEAPELARGFSARSSKTCVWDLGVVMLKMAFGLDVVEEFTSPSDCITNSSFITPFTELLENMLQAEPRRRSKAFDLQNVTFFRDKKDSLFSKSASAPVTPSRRRQQSSSQNLNSSNRYEEEWTEMATIGKGGQAKVVKARNHLDGQFYAVKKVVCESRKQLDIIVAEIKLLGRLNHPLIVRYFNAWDEKEYSDINEIEVSSEAVSNAADVGMENDPFAMPSTGVDFHMSSAVDNIGIQFGHEASDGDEEGIETAERRFRDQKADNSGWSSSSDEDNELPEGSDLQVPDHHREAMFTPREAEPEKITLYIQMELCENKTLRYHLENLVNDAKEGWRMFRQILEGLSHIQKHAIVHRDLKPDNIFIDAANNVRIGDFGLATTGQVTGSSRPHIKNLASRETYSIGTPLYIAPELRSRGAGRYTMKADMFSLGIIFFEMCHRIKTAMERTSILTDLATPFFLLPDKFKEAEWSTQGRIIMRLVNHAQDSRPSAADLLGGGEIPQPVKDEEMQQYLTTMQHKDPTGYAELLSKYFANAVPRPQDLSWVSKAEDMPRLSDKAMSVFVRRELEEVFRRHGAVRTNRQNVFPKWEHYSAPATFLDKSGMVLQLPYDLTLPFARAIAHGKPDYQKAYVIGSVYRAAINTAEPIRRTEACFDYVSDNARDLSLKEAEAIKVIDESIGAFSELRLRHMDIFLNHWDLLTTILSFCRIKPEQYELVISNLSQLNTVGWHHVREKLRAKEVNIMETSLTTLARFDFHDDVEGTTAKLTKIFEGDPRLDRVTQLMDRLEHVVDCLKRLKMDTSVSISPLSNHSDQLYRGFLMFQCVDRDSRKILAVGGRYDNLIKSFQLRPGRPNVRAVGFRLNVADIIALNNGEMKQRLDSRMVKSMPIEIAIPALPRRCDVLVTSFEYNLHSSVCLNIIQELWANRINAELTDLSDNLDDFLAAYKNESYCLAVIVRPDVHSAVGHTIKVRNLNKKDETEVDPSHLVSYLKNELGGPQEQVTAKLRRMASAADTSAAGTDSNVDVIVLAPQHKSKKTNRQTVIDAALLHRRELADSFVSNAPIVAIETTENVLQSIRTTRIGNSESWRAMIQSAPQQETKYLQELQEQLRGWAEDGKEGAFVFNHRTRGCIYYDLGKAT